MQTRELATAHHMDESAYLSCVEKARKELATHNLTMPHLMKLKNAIKVKDCVVFKTGKITCEVPSFSVFAKHGTATVKCPWVTIYNGRKERENNAGTSTMTVDELADEQQMIACDDTTAVIMQGCTILGFNLQEAALAVTNVRRLKCMNCERDLHLLKTAHVCNGCNFTCYCSVQCAETWWDLCHSSFCHLIKDVLMERRNISDSRSVEVDIDQQRP